MAKLSERGAQQEAVAADVAKDEEADGAEDLAGEEGAEAVGGAEDGDGDGEGELDVAVGFECHGDWDVRGFHG